MSGQNQLVIYFIRAGKLQELKDLEEDLADLKDQLLDPELDAEDKAELEAEQAELMQRRNALLSQKAQLEQDVKASAEAQALANAKQAAADEVKPAADVAKALMDHLNATNDLAASRQIEADACQKLADEAKALAEAKRQYAESLKPDAQEASEELPELQDELQDVQKQLAEIEQELLDPTLDDEDREELLEEIEELMEEKAELQEEIEELKQDIAAAQKAELDAAAAADEALAAQQKADMAQALADAVKKEKTPVYAGGNLDITARDHVGSEEDAMEITAGGVTNITSQTGNVYTAHSAHVNLGTIRGENVNMHTSGDIRPVDDNSGIYTGIQDDPTTEADESETETTAQVNALGSSAGTDDQPLVVDADRISGTVGDNANILIPHDVIVDQLTAGGHLELTAEGDIEAGMADEGAANITGGSIELNAEDVGDEEKPLVIDLIPQPGNIKGLSGDVEDIYLKTLGNVLIRELRGEDVHIESAGRVDGAPDNGWTPDIYSLNLFISAMHGVGTEENPLVIYNPGRVSILTKYGSAFFVNVYRPAQRIVTKHCCCLCAYWLMVIEQIMEAEKDAIVEIAQIVPCGRMPEAVMRALRERSDVTLVLHLEDEDKLTIEAGKALKEKLGVTCYDMDRLVSYYFWLKVVEDIEKAKEGQTLEIQEPVPGTRMPESVMKALRERSDVTLILHLEEGGKLTIEAGKALAEKPDVKSYDLNWLVCHYFWLKVVEGITETEEGGTLEITDTVPCCRMTDEAIRALTDRSDVTLILHLEEGETLTIEAGTAAEYDGSFGCCDYWDMVVERILAAEEGQTLEIPEIISCTRMPETVMQALRERDDVTLILHPEEDEELKIAAGTALETKADVTCYDLEQLIGYYFWNEVIESIETAEEDETLEISEAVPCTIMPEKVLDALREREDVSLALHMEDGVELMIEAGAVAQYKIEMAFYDLYWLVHHFMGHAV